MGQFLEQHLDRCLQQLQHTLDSHQSADVELEFRLGRIIKLRQQERFEPDIGQKRWNTIWQALSAYRQWDWILGESCTDYYMPNGDRITWHDDDRWSSMKKTRCTDVDIATDGPFDVRISVSLEVPGQKPVYGAQGSSYWRQKQRVSFRHRMWSIDLTRVVSSKSTDSDNAECYELELELADKTALSKFPLAYLLHFGLLMVEDMFNLVEEC